MNLAPVKTELLAQGKGDVVEDGERVEPCAVLKDDGESPPLTQEVDLAEGQQIEARDVDAPRVGLLQGAWWGARPREALEYLGGSQVR